MLPQAVRLQNDFTAEPFSLPRPLSLTQVLGTVLLSYVVFLVVLSLAGGSYWFLVGGGFGDNPSFLQAARAIRHWQFSGVSVKQFWGLPYAMAGVSVLTRAPEAISLAVVCVSASLVGVALCYWLLDGWIAVFFALLSLDWFKLSLLGGSEPLFVALLLGSFLALRRDRWIIAAVLASLATVVRPFGIFILAGLGIHLLYRKRFRDCASATAIGLGIGFLYIWPLQHYLGSPFANVASYQQNDWRGGVPFNLPLVAIVRDTIRIHAPLTNHMLAYSWILFLLLGMAVAIRSGEFLRLAKDHTAEACFVVLYGLAIYSYDAPGWSRSEFSRFAVPLLPWTLFFVRRYLPTNRKVAMALAVIAPSLAAASAVGIRQTGELLLRHLR
jgi:hypothetical protein